MVEVAVQENPEYPYIEERFDAIVDSVMAIANLPGDKYSLGIAPMGIMMDFQPMGNNEGAIGHDLMDPCQVCHRTPQETRRAIFIHPGRWWPGPVEATRTTTRTPSWGRG